MGRTPSGSVVTATLAHGTRRFRLRFLADGRREEVVLHERPDCECGCGGGWSERSARIELENIVARVRAGLRYRGRARSVAGAARIPTFHEYASIWLERKVHGAIGDRPLAPSTAAQYRTALTQRLLPYFARFDLDRIDRRECLEFKAQMLREAADLRAAIAAGADLRDARRRRLVPLSASSVRKVIGVLAMVLDDAVEDELIERNPARGKRMRIQVPKPARTFLELDELADLLDTAGAQDAPPEISSEGLSGEATRAKVARAAAGGSSLGEITAELGLSKATVSFHLARMDASCPAYVGRRAAVELLARSGLRVGELCELRMGDVRFHDRDGAPVRPRGEDRRRRTRGADDPRPGRGVRRAPRPPTPRRPAHRPRCVCAPKQARRAHQPPARRPARPRRRRGSQYPARRARPSAPARATPHTLRRTYISIALLANNFDVKWVMSQVGHADSKMTLDVYAQLEQRIDREHGKSFDRLVRQARRQFGIRTTPRPEQRRG